MKNMSSKQDNPAAVYGFDNRVFAVSDLQCILPYVKIENLRTMGFLRRVGPDKGGHWEVIGSVV